MEQKKGLTTKEAFEKLISQRAWYTDIGISSSTANSLASRYRAGENISDAKIEEILDKAGFKVVQEKLWK